MSRSIRSAPVPCAHRYRFTVQLESISSIELGCGAGRSLPFASLSPPVQREVGGRFQGSII